MVLFGHYEKGLSPSVRTKEVTTSVLDKRSSEPPVQASRDNVVQILRWSGKGPDHGGEDDRSPKDTVSSPFVIHEKLFLFQPLSGPPRTACRKVLEKKVGGSPTFEVNLCRVRNPCPPVPKLRSPWGVVSHLGSPSSGHSLRRLSCHRWRVTGHVKGRVVCSRGEKTGKEDLSVRPRVVVVKGLLGGSSGPRVTSALP